MPYCHQVKKPYKKVDEAIVDFLADTGVALRIVELESFKKLLKVANNKMI